MKQKIISLPQTVLLLFICRMFLIVTYSPSPNYEEKIGSNAIVFGGLLGIACTFVLLIPLFLLFRGGAERDLLTRCERLSGTFGKIVSGYFVLLTLLILVNTACQFTFFMTNAVFTQTSSLLILLALLAACVYSAAMGIEGLARANSIIFFLFVLSMLFIVVFSGEKIEWYNFPLVTNTSMKAIWSTAAEGIARNVELALLVLLLPKMKGSFAKASVWYVLSTALMLMIIGGVVVLVLGKFAVRQVFPFYTVASIVETDLLQRLDALHMALWVLVTFVRMSVYLIICAETGKRLLPGSVRKYALAGVSVLVFAAAWAISGSLSVLQNLNFFMRTGILLGIGIVLIPLILLCLHKKEKAFRMMEKGGRSK